MFRFNFDIWLDISPPVKADYSGIRSLELLIRANDRRWIEATNPADFPD